MDWHRDHIDPASIIRRFRIQGEVDSVTKHGNGHINRTYLVRTKAPDDPDYILQEINTNVFMDIRGLMRNMETVLDHLQTKADESGDPEFCASVPKLIPTSSGLPYIDDARSGTWRCITFIKNSMIYEKVTDPELAREAGKVIGEFQARLADLKTPLVITLQRFHDIEYRLEQFDDVFMTKSNERKEATSVEQEFVNRRRKAMQNYLAALRNVKIPVRVTHNDTKVNNILFSKDGVGKCMIDLDTVMPGYIHFDFGDALRTLGSTAVEDEGDVERIRFDLDLFRSFSDGYIQQISKVMTCEELELLPFAPLYLTYMQGVRFLTDHLNGDVYFSTSKPDHNLIRAKAQFRLLESMEAQMREMEISFQEILKAHQK